MDVVLGPWTKDHNITYVGFLGERSSLSRKKFRCLKDLFDFVYEELGRRGRTVEPIRLVSIERGDLGKNLASMLSSSGIDTTESASYPTLDEYMRANNQFRPFLELTHFIYYGARQLAPTPPRGGIKLESESAVIGPGDGYGPRKESLEMIK